MSKRKSVFPKVLEQMIVRGNDRGLSVAQITERVNNSRTAERLDVYYSVRTIAAKVANLNR